MSHTRILSAINVCDSQLQDRRERNPEQIRNLDVRNPAGMRPDGNHRPDKSAKDEQDIYRREKIVFQRELQRRKSKIENEIKNKWQSNHESNLFLPRH